MAEGGKLTRSNGAGWAMALPGFGLIAIFIVLPFFFAFALSFTNQRLISPNPTEYVGLANYRQLLGGRDDHAGRGPRRRGRRPARR